MTSKVVALLDEVEAVMRGEHGADWADHFGPLFNMIEDVRAGETGAPTDDSAAFAQFAEYIAREMPEGTVIGDPAWWAPRLWRFARYAKTNFEAGRVNAPRGTTSEQVAVAPKGSTCESPAPSDETSEEQGPCVSHLALKEWERMFDAWVKHQAGLPSDVPLWPNGDWSQDVAMVAHALAGSARETTVPKSRDFWVAWSDQNGGWIAAIDGCRAKREDIEGSIQRHVAESGFNRFELRPVRITAYLEEPPEKANCSGENGNG